MKACNLLQHSLTVVAMTALFVVASGAQTLRNNGTFTNTGTATYKEIQNYKTGTGGTIVNSGTLNTTTVGGGSGNLLNQSGGANGTIRNYSGASHGTISVANNLDNNAAGASFDNDNAGVGRLLVAGSITNAGTFDTDSGAVDYNGSGAQSIFTTTYGALVASGSNTKTMSGTVMVRDTFRITGVTFAFNATTDSLALRATTLTNTSGTFSASGGIVNYGADADQTLLAAASYYRLYLSGSTAPRTKTYAGSLAFAASGLLNVGSNDTLSVTSNLDLNANTPSFTNSSTVKMGGNATFHGGITDAGTFYYYGSSAQTIGAVTYADLRLGNTGGKTFPAGTVAVTGNYAIDGSTGARDYTTNSNTFAFAGTSGTQTISGLSETFHIMQFSGAALKSLGGTAIGAARLDVLGTSGVVTNDVTTVTLTNITGVSLTIASGGSLTNNATKTITMNGDLENDGTITNAGSITVY